MKNNQQYIIPPRPHRYPVPKPGPIPRTKKEWIPCPICTTLFLRRIGKEQNPKTCPDIHCKNQYSREKQKYRSRHFERRKKGHQGKRFREDARPKTNNESWKKVRLREKTRRRHAINRYKKIIEKLWSNNKNAM